MLVVGLTGGIGSGKSTLARELDRLGAVVIDADVVARSCVEPGSPVLAAVIARFGEHLLNVDGSLDRSALARLVFADGAARRDLEALTHPCIHERIDAEVRALAALDPPPALLVIEHPLLIEAGVAATVDAVVVVTAPLEQRVERLVTERGMTPDDAHARIAAQTDDATRQAAADHVVHNGGDPAMLREAAEALHAALLSTRGDLP